jgi:hypothetical protein
VEPVNVVALRQQVDIALAESDHFTLIDPSSAVRADVRTRLQRLYRDTAGSTSPEETAP